VLIRNIAYKDRLCYIPEILQVVLCVTVLLNKNNYVTVCKKGRIQGHPETSSAQ
jgi:hypothetical protein